MLKQLIEQDIKTALLDRDTVRVTTLRGLKSAILYAEVAANARDTGLPEDVVQAILVKESKKRQESADLYEQGKDSVRAEAELAEKAIIDAYLPKPLSDEELSALVDTVILEVGDTSPQAMGKVIAGVKEKSKGSADGGRIAQLVKERLSK